MKSIKVNGQVYQYSHSWEELKEGCIRHGYPSYKMCFEYEEIESMTRPTINIFLITFPGGAEYRCSYCSQFDEGYLQFDLFTANHIYFFMPVKTIDEVSLVTRELGIDEEDLFNLYRLGLI